MLNLLAEVFQVCFAQKEAKKYHASLKNSTDASARFSHYETSVESCPLVCLSDVGAASQCKSRFQGLWENYDACWSQYDRWANSDELKRFKRRGRNGVDDAASFDLDAEQVSFSVLTLSCHPRWTWNLSYTRNICITILREFEEFVRCFTRETYVSVSSGNLRSIID